jgi:sporulation protein YlmC with PRC-barrel domain
MRTTFTILTLTVMLLTGSTVMAADQPTPGTSPGTEKMPATQGELMKSVPSDALPISEYYKAAVYDPKDAKIGDVEDVLLDKNGKVDAVMLGVGGFLGIGEKDVAVPFNAIKVTEKNGEAQRDRVSFSRWMTRDEATATESKLAEAIKWSTPSEEAMAVSPPVEDEPIRYDADDLLREAEMRRKFTRPIDEIVPFPKGII